MYAYSQSISPQGTKNNQKEKQVAGYADDFGHFAQKKNRIIQGFSF